MILRDAQPVAAPRCQGWLCVRCRFAHGAGQLVRLRHSPIRRIPGDHNVYLRGFCFDPVCFSPTRARPPHHTESRRLPLVLLWPRHAPSAVSQDETFCSTSASLYVCGLTADGAGAESFGGSAVQVSYESMPINLDLHRIVPKSPPTAFVEGGGGTPPTSLVSTGVGAGEGN